MTSPYMVGWLGQAKFSHSQLLLPTSRAYSAAANNP